MSPALPRAIALAALLAASALGASADVLAVRAGRIETAAGDAIENGVILIENGRISAVGADVEIPGGTETIDASAGSVVPGFVNPATGIGLSPSRPSPSADNCVPSGM